MEKRSAKLVRSLLASVPNDGRASIGNSTRARAVAPRSSFTADGLDETAESPPQSRVAIQLEASRFPTDLAQRLCSKYHFIRRTERFRAILTHIDASIGDNNEAFPLATSPCLRILDVVSTPHEVTLPFPRTPEMHDFVMGRIARHTAGVASGVRGNRVIRRVNIVVNEAAREQCG